MEDKHKRILSCFLPKLVNEINPRLMLVYLPCLSTCSKEEVDTAERSQSRTYAVMKLHDHLIRRPEGWRQLIDALRHPDVNQGHLADLLESNESHDNQQQYRQSSPQRQQQQQQQHHHYQQQQQQSRSLSEEPRRAKDITALPGSSNKKRFRPSSDRRSALVDGDTPVRLLNNGVEQILGRLDSVGLNNADVLAGHFGFTVQQVDEIRSSTTNGRLAFAFFKAWSHQKEATLGRLMSILWKMERLDVVDELEKLTGYKLERNTVPKDTLTAVAASQQDQKDNEHSRRPFSENCIANGYEKVAQKATGRTLRGCDEHIRDTNNAEFKAEIVFTDLPTEFSHLNRNTSENPRVSPTLCRSDGVRNDFDSNVIHNHSLSSPTAGYPALRSPLKEIGVTFVEPGHEIQQSYVEGETSEILRKGHVVSPVTSANALDNDKEIILYCRNSEPDDDTDRAETFTDCPINQGVADCMSLVMMDGGAEPEGSTVYGTCTEPSLDGDNLSSMSMLANVAFRTNGTNSCSNLIGNTFPHSFTPCSGLSPARSANSRHNTTTSDVHTAGSTTSDVHSAGSTTSDVNTAGSTTSDVHIAGSTTSDVNTAGSTTSDVNTAGSTTSDVNTAVSTTSDVHRDDSTQSDVHRDDSTQSDVHTDDSTQSDVHTDNSTQSDVHTDDSTQSDVHRDDSTQSDVHTDDSTTYAHTLNEEEQISNVTFVKTSHTDVTPLRDDSFRQTQGYDTSERGIFGVRGELKANGVTTKRDIGVVPGERNTIEVIGERDTGAVHIETAFNEEFTPGTSDLIQGEQRVPEAASNNSYIDNTTSTRSLISVFVGGIAIAVITGYYLAKK